MEEQHKPRRLDTTVRLQNLLVTAAIGVASLVGGYMALKDQIRGVEEHARSLDDHDRQQSDRMTRIESSILDQRADTRDSLRGISSDLKDLSNKFDQMKDQMISNSVAARPDMQRWAK